MTTPVQNIFWSVQNMLPVSGNSFFKQFKVDDLLFLEYKCVADEAAAKVWSAHNYFLYVVRGKKV